MVPEPVKTLRKIRYSKTFENFSNFWWFGIGFFVVCKLSIKNTSKENKELTS